MAINGNSPAYNAMPDPGMAFVPPGDGGSAIKRPQAGPFASFVQTVAPDPTPTRGQFYRQGVRDYFLKSYWNTNTEYYKNLKKHPERMGWVTGVSLGLGALFTMFTRFRGAIHYAAAFLALAIPIMHGMRTLPKMSDAYQKVKDGNPTEGRNQFAKSLNDFVYNIFQAFLKPMSFGFMTAFVLSLPRVFRPNIQLMWSEEHIAKPILKKLHIGENNLLIKGLNHLYDPLARMGGVVEGKLTQSAPWLLRIAQRLS